MPQVGQYDLIDQTQAALIERDPDSRADMLRDLSSELTRGIQNQAARLMTTLYRVGHFLPQPYAIGSVTSQTRALGRNYARDVLALITESFDNDASANLGNGPFGIDEVAPLLPALSPSALMSMSFLENATALIDEITPSQEDEDDQRLDMLPPHAPRRFRQRDDEQMAERPPRLGPATQMGGATSSTTPPVTPPRSTTGGVTSHATGKNATMDAHGISQGEQGSTTRTSPTSLTTSSTTVTTSTTPTVPTEEAEGVDNHEGTHSGSTGDAGEGNHQSPRRSKRKHNKPVEDSKSIKKYMNRY